MYINFPLLHIIMVSELLLCWSPFYAIKEPALGRSHVAMPSAGPSLHLPLLSTLTISYYSVVLGPYLHSRLRPSPSSANASSSEISPTTTSPFLSSTRDDRWSMSDDFTIPVFDERRLTSDDFTIPAVDERQSTIDDFIIPAIDRDDRRAKTSLFRPPTRDDRQAYFQTLGVWSTVSLRESVNRHVIHCI